MRRREFAHGWRSVNQNGKDCNPKSEWNAWLVATEVHAAPQFEPLKIQVYAPSIPLHLLKYRFNVKHGLGVLRIARAVVIDMARFGELRFVVLLVISRLHGFVTVLLLITEIVVRII